MGKTSKDKEKQLLEWVKHKPELFEKLQQMQALEQDGEDIDLDGLELELLELVKSMGAQSFGRCVQAREEKAFELAKSKGGGRLHSKKN